jgi:hypothetical protein
MFKIRKLENTITHRLNPTFLKFSFVVKIGVKTFK